MQMQKHPALYQSNILNYYGVIPQVTCTETYGTAELKKMIWVLKHDHHNHNPRNFRSQERKFPRVELSLPIMKVPWNFRSLELSFPYRNEH